MRGKESEHVTYREYTASLVNINRELKELNKAQKESSSTQKEILANQIRCDSRHEESETIANNDRDNYVVLNTKVSGYEKSLIKTAAAFIVTFGLGGAGLYTLIPPPVETVKPEPVKPTTPAKP